MSQRRRDHNHSHLSSHHDTSQVLDLAYLSEQTFGDEALIKELLSLFSNQAVQLLQQAKEAMQGDVCRDAVHKLSGSARAIGAWSVAESASDIEFQLINHGEDLSFLHDNHALNVLENQLNTLQIGIRNYLDHAIVPTKSQGSLH